MLCREILHVDLTEMSKNVRAKRGRRLPVVLSVNEEQRLFAEVDESRRLMVELLYGSGLRLSELLRLRIKDIDFDNGLIVVRSGKGDKDRTTILPTAVREALRDHLSHVKKLFEKDLADGRADVALPDALARKYPNTSSEWKWQWVFPATNLSRDPRSGCFRKHHVSPRYVQSAIKLAIELPGKTDRSVLQS